MKIGQEKPDLEPKVIEIDGVDPVVLGRHVELLYSAGYLEGIAQTAGLNVTVDHKTIFVRDLSWEGHEFVGALGNDDVWHKMTDSVGVEQIASMPLKVVKDAAIAAATFWLKSKLGL